MTKIKAGSLLVLNCISAPLLKTNWLSTSSFGVIWKLLLATEQGSHCVRTGNKTNGPKLIFSSTKHIS